MAEKTKGIYRLVTIPAVYERIQTLLSGAGSYERLGALLFGGLENKRVLEIGCGPGRWAPALGHAASYTGIDWNQSHIDQARARHASGKVNFICGDLSDPSLLAREGGFDAVIGIGILHHLDDQTARNVLAQASRILGPDGVFIGIEPVRHKGQNPVARLLKALDSGQNIRTIEGYRSLVPEDYARLETDLRTDLMRVPYSHLIMRAYKTPVA